MIAEYNRKSLMIGIPGLILQIVCQVLSTTMASHGNMTLLSWVLLAGLFAGSVLLIIGLVYYAKGKGYSGALGLLGLLSCLGLLILAVLPDKTK
jgi:hypothetical protein